MPVTYHEGYKLIEANDHHRFLIDKGEREHFLPKLFNKKAYILRSSHFNPPFMKLWGGPSFWSISIWRVFFNQNDIWVNGKAVKYRWFLSERCYHPENCMLNQQHGIAQINDETYSFIFSHFSFQKLAFRCGRFTKPAPEKQIWYLLHPQSHTFFDLFYWE